MKEHNKRWLMSMMKTSGSQRRYIMNGNYSDERNKKKDDIENLPSHESIKSTYSFYNGKINTSPLKRFLRVSVNKDWDEVYSEIISRIPTKLLDYKEMIFWYVANDVCFIEDKLWDKKSQSFIWINGSSFFYDENKKVVYYSVTEYFVHPETNKLCYIPQKTFNKRI